MGYLARVFVLVLTTVLLYSSAVAQEGSVAGMTLKLVDRSGKTISTTESSADGAWSFTIPASGEYAIAVDESEFQEARTEIAAKVPNAVFAPVTMTAQSGPLVTIGWSMKDLPWIACYESKRDPSTGLAVGEKKYKAVQFIRELSQSVAILECKQGGTASGTLSYTVRK